MSDDKPLAGAQALGVIHGSTSVVRVMLSQSAYEHALIYTLGRMVVPACSEEWLGSQLVETRMALLGGARQDHEPFARELLASFRQTLSVMRWSAELQAIALEHFADALADAIAIESSTLAEVRARLTAEVQP